MDQMLSILLALGPTLIIAQDPAWADIGRWTTHIDFPLIPNAGAVLPDQPDSSRILVWSAYSAASFGGDRGYTATAIYDMNTGQTPEINVTNTHHDMFCPGINTDFDGNIVVTGGSSAAATSSFNPRTNNWTQMAPMNKPRGYQSATTLSNGKWFTIGGSWSGGLGNKTGEIYDPATGEWTILPGCPSEPLLTVDQEGIFREDNHAWLFSWKDGWVFQAGPSNKMNWYDTKGTGAVQAAGVRNGPGGKDQMCGPAIMYDIGKIFAIAGAQNYQESPAFTTANIITITEPGVDPQVSWSGNAKYARAFSNSVVLPDGKIFICGGQTWALPFTDGNSSLIPEIFDPETRSFKDMAIEPSPRNYHSIALLLPDATVLSAGGGLCYDGCPYNMTTADHLDGDIWRPPYLYDSSGNDAVRPVISQMVSSRKASNFQVPLGGTLAITLGEQPAAVPQWALIRLPTATHTIDTDSRRIAVGATSGSNGTYSISIPSDAGILLPGFYYIFAVVEGVPSVSKTIQITLT